ncbi:glycosyltransferase [Cnuibacter physcomitrellae]|uniref:glycosyltransferase n=1 Tax=Cnuibacter physcomitrellae TaxID=1619308 RepID=UPI002175B8B9|nr:glycosyltransferase [Cnuibacter physcomitrellae]MCS5497372.1 glycosyltransferase [Cnuibacter physcomitrellae]
MRGTPPSERLRIVVIGPLRYPLRQPHAGGLEAMVWDRVQQLRQRGHEVTLCAVQGSDFLEGSPPEFVMPGVQWLSDADASDTDYPVGYVKRASRSLENALAYIRRHADRFDVIDNHCLQGPPIAAAASLGVPVVTTLHTPPLPEMLAAHAASIGSTQRFLAVSAHTARAWRQHGVHAEVMPNSVDLDRWPLGKGGDALVWSGRIVPEKGTHLAIDAARMTGRTLVVAGRIGDRDYFDQQVAPRLGGDVRYVGPLPQAELADLVGRSACALVTPLWDEPFGLVIPEALATGTPVVAFDAGGVGESIAPLPSALVPPGDVRALAEAASHAASLGSAHPETRWLTRRTAERRFDAQGRAHALEQLFRQVVDESTTMEISA